MTEQQNSSVNPFLSVWLHPKKTARFVIENKGMAYLFFVIAISYLGVFSSSLIDMELYPLFSIWVIVILLLLLSPLFGIMMNAIYALIVWPVGKLFKGVGNYQDVFKGMALTSIPYIPLIPFYLLWMMTDPYSLFYADAEGNFIIPLITSILTVVASIWCFVISIAIVAEVHKISNWKAFFVLFIPAVIFIIFLIVIVVIISLIIFGIGTAFMF